MKILVIGASRGIGLIMRPGFLTNGPRAGKRRVLTEIDGVTARSVSRAEVADFILLDRLDAASFSRQTLLLTY
ncbi:MAG TPA: NAD(P)H-binding protein [Methylocystis sp.]|nr:NAD(P)H-binding protein [Methylocystis sp.]